MKKRGEKLKSIPVVLGVLLLAAAGCAAVVQKEGAVRPAVAYGIYLGAGLVFFAVQLTYCRLAGRSDDFSKITTAIYIFLYPFQLALAYSLTNTPLRYAVAGVSIWLYLSFMVNMMALMVKPLMRPLWFRVLISYPSTGSFCAAIFGFVLLPCAWLPYPGDIIACVLVPHLLGLTGVIQSLLPVPTQWDNIRLEVGPNVEPIHGEKAVRMKHGSKSPAALRIVQLTDVHLGAFMSEARLRNICTIAVSHNPDIILLTGDFHTPESDHTPGSLERALEPLRGVRNVYASLGNHDVESPEVFAKVRDALEELGIALLVDGDTTTNIRGRSVRIIGHGWPHRIAGAMRSMAPDNTDTLNIHLLHDPGYFTDIPDTGALALGGHTHGGQMGLFSLGFNATLVGVATGHPDHSLWAAGRNRLWAHRGQGFRSLSCQWVPRLGVPPEYSVLAVTWKGGGGGGNGGGGAGNGLGAESREGVQTHLDTASSNEFSS